eukprot:TRINITY_DN7380_c0_g1_i2.p1 TRINITY_DN7380_c0_g1~~TRINITY_DN7380_c0_g1_i2.p1  ORF type:complete len:389 (-),score=53.88 TRINITY_DN7380_c0_g1_i2:128-1294(-)
MLHKVMFKGNIKKANCPLLIIYFDGTVGDISCSNPFAGESVIKYKVRTGADKAFKSLQRSYQLAVIRRMSSSKFSKFLEYFAKKGVHFDAIYKDCRTDTRATLINYSRIIKDFNCFHKTPIQSLILNHYDAESSFNQLPEIQPELLYSSNNTKTFLIPHLKLSEPNIPDMQRILNAMLNLCSSTTKPQADCANNAETCLNPSVEGCRKVRSRSAVSVPLDKEFVEVGGEWRGEAEIGLYNRWAAINYKINKDKRQSVDGEKNKASKTEMISNLMTSKLTAYDCLRLANQYSKLTESVYGKLSEAAKSEAKIEMKKNFYINYLGSMQKDNHGRALIFPYSNIGVNKKTSELIATEKYALPYLNLNVFLQRKNPAVLVKRKSYISETKFL